MATSIQIRRDVSTNWEKVNPVLLDGEIGYEEDTKQKKIGDGVTRWNSLPYFGNPNVQERGDSTTETMSQAAVTRELQGLETSIGEILIDYGTAASKYGGSPAIDYGNASTVAIDF